MFYFTCERSLRPPTNWRIPVGRPWTSWLRVQLMKMFSSELTYLLTTRWSAKRQGRVRGVLPLHFRLWVTDMQWEAFVV